MDLSYDVRNGLYFALSGRAVLTEDEGPQFLGFDANAGYAVRLGSSLAADAGVIHSAYSHYSGLSAGRSYTEVYAGITGKVIGARISVSPNYLGSPHWTAYGELYGHMDLSRRTVLSAAVGALSSVDGGYYGAARPQFNARLDIGHRVGPAMLHAAVIARSRAYLYSEHSSASTALVVGLSTAL
jgi:hypothetical protein